MSFIAVPGITPLGQTLLHTKSFSHAGTASSCKTRESTDSFLSSGKDLPTVCADTLRDFVFMVWENQVLPTAMDVDAVTQVLLGHDRTFQVPTGPAPAPWAIPAGQGVFGWFPQDELSRVSFEL